jgi:hypothetical protein
LNFILTSYASITNVGSKSSIFIFTQYFSFACQIPDEAGGGGCDGMIPPLKNEILPITGLVLKIA